MININVSPSGEINITQSAAPRGDMYVTYNQGSNEKGEPDKLYGGEESSDNQYPSDDYEGLSEQSEIGKQDFDTPENQDELNTVWFKSGWDSALKECMLNFVSGRLPQFFNEVGMDFIAKDPHHNEPEGTGETGFSEATLQRIEEERDPREGQDFDMQESESYKQMIAMEALRNANGIPMEPMEAPSGPKQVGWSANQDGTPDYHRPIFRNEDGSLRFSEKFEPTEGPGEQITSWDDAPNAGTWTMSDDELNSRIEEAESRGYRNGHQVAFDEVHAEWAKQAAVKPVLSREKLLHTAQEIVSADTIRTFATGGAVPTQFHEAFGPSVENFVVPLVESLGFKVEGF